MHSRFILSETMKCTLGLVVASMGMVPTTGFAFSPLASFLSPLSPLREHTSAALSSVSVPISELEKDLTPAERSITSVVRKCGPSVAYVTTVYPASTTSGSLRQSQTENGTPSGRSLGSGSGFQVTPGYVCTNYHVIERAYSIQQSFKNLDTMIDQIARDATALFPEELVKIFKSKINDAILNDEAPVVYVRINSDTKYQKCRIVDVEPDLDLAVLKIESSEAVDSNTVSFGSSSDLLVGQFVVAIGNPFALDKTVTTGVVSALNREFRAGTARTPANTPIRNCIQTDAAINPGNSGGPLLNLKGEVVGINTAIITTSGSNAGIGFAVPADQLRPVVDRIIQQDRVASGERRDSGWLGVSIVRQSGNSTLMSNNWIAEVAEGSPAELAGIRPLRIQQNGTVELGDAIVAVSSNKVLSFDELQVELEDRAKGEQIALTVEDAAGEKRVVYITLGQKPRNV
jgi:S1-C subfamily serine protease